MAPDKHRSPIFRPPHPSFISAASPIYEIKERAKFFHRFLQLLLIQFGIAHGSNRFAGVLVGKPNSSTWMAPESQRHTALGRRRAPGSVIASAKRSLRCTLPTHCKAKRNEGCRQGLGP